MIANKNYEADKVHHAAKSPDFTFIEYLAIRGRILFISREAQEISTDTGLLLPSVLRVDIDNSLCNYRRETDLPKSSYRPCCSRY